MKECVSECGPAAATQINVYCVNCILTFVMHKIS